MEEQGIAFSLTDVIDALEGTSDDIRYYANPSTGMIVFSSEMFGTEDFDDFDEDELEGDEWVALPDRFDIDSWSFMRDYAWAIGGGEGDELLDAIHGKGAFRNFRRLVERRGALESWHAYENMRYRELAVGWLDENGLPWKDDVPEAWKGDWRALLPASIREKLTLEVLGPAFSVCKVASARELAKLLETGTCFVARTADELSAVCETAVVPAQTLAREDGWRALKVAGPLDFGLVGILAKIAGALAEAQVPLFAVSTFDTDYVLVKERDLKTAIGALRAAGCEVDG